jgi:hypothetical protein
MRFTIVAVLFLLLLIPAGLFLSRVIAKASTTTTASPQKPVVVQGIGDRMVNNPKGKPFKPAWHAGFSADFPSQDNRSGKFSVTGKLQINPDPNCKVENISVRVLVEDVTTKRNLDTRDHGTLIVDPMRSYTKVVTEKFNLPPGMFRIRFRADYVGNPSVVFAEHTCVVTVK